jgi:8-oxo-dGTP pyrophosphatase MutT (NUDIX family)
MTERFPYVGAVYLILRDQNKILLQRRFNTGFEDGNYGLPAGHLDGNETTREGLAREAKEELGIDIDPKSLQVLHVMHRKASLDEKIDFFMTTNMYRGEVQNLEPHKCDHLEWFDVDDLPQNIITYVNVALELIKKKETYSEYGW